MIKKVIAIASVFDSITKDEIYEYEEMTCNVITILKDDNGNKRFLHRSLFKAIE